MGIFSLFFNFSKQFVSYYLDLKKYLKTIPNNFVIF